jgi:hypothetical protein
MTLRKLRFAFLLLATFLTGAHPMAIAIPEAWTGTWSAPSLSRPSIPIIISLETDGTATEQIGDYSGTGTWKIEGAAAKIHWSSKWTGLLRPAANGGFELLTWKSDTHPDQSPDDIQPARRISSETDK